MESVRIFLANNPFVRVILPFALGIQVSLFTALPLWLSRNLLLAVCGLLLLSAYLHFRSPWRRRYWIGPVSLLVFFFGGFIISEAYKPHNHSDYYGHFSGNRLFVEVQSAVEPRENVDRAIVNVLSVADSTHSRETSGKLLVYLRHDEDNQKWIPGTRLMIHGRRDSIPAPLNPGQFNFRRYMGFHGVNFQIFVNRDDWTFYSQRSYWRTWLHEARVFLRDRLHQHGFSEDSRAVLSALLLGQRQFIDEELRRAYASAGAMHVLAVSGLHVGIIFLLINAVTGRMRRSKHLRMVSLAITLGALWTYAAITGLSPSVLRAATMFSFIALATHNDQRGHIYNNLAASAFLLLCFSPGLLVEVGFQLSYLAVVGIVFLQPKIYRLWEPKNWLLDKAWALTAVSISAQLATFPLGLLYFHQFPNYFLLSNLLVIPSAMVILYSGILLLIAGGSLFGEWLAWWLDNFVGAMNGILRWIESRPLSLIQEISFSIPETLLIYASIISVIVFLTRQTRFRYWLAIALITVLFSWQVTEEVVFNGQRKIIVYSIRGETAINIMHGREQDFLTTEELYRDESQMLFNVKNAWFANDLRPPEWIPLKTASLRGGHSIWNHPYWAFGDKKLMILNRQLDDIAPADTVDWILLRNNPYVELEELARYTREAIIADGSNGFYARRHWNQVADSLNIPFWDCMKRGSYVGEW